MKQTWTAEGTTARRAPRRRRANPPTTWSEAENLQWKVDVDGLGNSTPIVSKSSSTACEIGATLRVSVSPAGSLLSEAVSPDDCAVADSEATPAASVDCDAVVETVAADSASAGVATCIDHPLLFQTVIEKTIINKFQRIIVPIANFPRSDRAKRYRSPCQPILDGRRTTPPFAKEARPEARDGQWSAGRANDPAPLANSWLFQVAATRVQQVDPGCLPNLPDPTRAAHR